jgi:hypothetical protein
MTKPLRKLRLEDEPLWVETNSIAEEIYKILSDIPEDEKWDIASKLRTSAVNLMFSIAEALGDARPVTTEFEWGESRKYIASLKTIYRFAGKQGFFELDPNMMVRFDKLMSDIDDKIAAAYDQTEADNKHDLDMWRTKYQLWREKASEN